LIASRALSGSACSWQPLEISLDQPPVADAASDLFRDIFGSDKLAVRLVIGVASLPLGMPIELEIPLRLRNRLEDRCRR